MEHRNFTSIKTKQQLLIIFPESPSFSLISLSEFIFPDFQVARHPVKLLNTVEFTLLATTNEDVSLFFFRFHYVKFVQNWIDKC